MWCVPCQAGLGSPCATEADGSAEMRMHLLIAALVVMLPGAIPSYARTWTVMQDGSGDFLDIQSAVDACAVGDSVLVGPGRYEGYHPFIPGDDDIGWEVIVGVAVDSLTIRGVDSETVIIGPAATDDDRLVRIGIATSVLNTWIVLENIRIENIGGRGVDIVNSGRVYRCQYVNMMTGLALEVGHDVLVEECLFAQTQLVVSHISDTILPEVIVRNTQFESGAGVYVNQHPNTIVTECRFNGVTVAANGLNGANLYVESCEMNGGNIAIAGTNYGDGSIDVRDCQMNDQAVYAIQVYGTHLAGSGNTIRTLGDYAIQVPNSSADFHGNHIFKAGVGTVDVQFYTVPDQGLDFSGNWWGTSDADSIAAWKIGRAHV